MSLRYAANEFALTGDPVTLAASPSSAYHEVRMGLDLRAEIGRARIVLDGAYRQPVATGVLDARFTRRSVGAIDVGLGLRVRVFRELAIGARLDYLRYFYDLKPEPFDAYIAGGALDQQYRARVDISWRFR